MAQDAGASEAAVIGIVVLDGVEDDGQARELVPDGDRRVYAVHLSGELHVHKDYVGAVLQAVGQGLLAALAIVGHAHSARALQPRFERGAQVLAVFDE